jgi:hypothetical protein
MATQYTAGFVQGQKNTAAIMNQIGAAWETWTPTLTQSATVTFTNTSSRYMRIQKLVIAQTYLTVSGAGTAGQNVLVGLPVTAQNASGQIAGYGWLYDASTTTVYNVIAYMTATTSVSLMYTPNATGGAFGSNPAVTLGASDQVRLSFVYEAA